MAAIDLDAIKTAVLLVDPSAVIADVGPMVGWNIQSGSTGIKVFGTGVVTMVSRDPERDMPVIQAVLRHVQPEAVADQAAVRERIADAIWRQFGGVDDRRDDAWFREAVEAVLGALNDPA